jgi:hypothetical protein
MYIEDDGDDEATALIITNLLVKLQKGPTHCVGVQNSGHFSNARFG